MFDVNDLPEKGVKRERAIFQLCSDEANGPVLLELAQTEKGKCKTVAQKALAQLEFGLLLLKANLWASTF